MQMNRVNRWYFVCVCVCVCVPVKCTLKGGDNYLLVFLPLDKPRQRSKKRVREDSRKILIARQNIKYCPSYADLLFLFFSHFGEICLPGSSFAGRACVSEVALLHTPPCFPANSATYTYQETHTHTHTLEHKSRELLGRKICCAIALRGGHICILCRFQACNQYVSELMSDISICN